MFDSQRLPHLSRLRRVPYLAKTVFFAALSMFSKEHGITVLGVCFIAEVLNTYHTRNKEVCKKRNDCSMKSPINARKLYVSDCIKNLLCLTLSTITLIILRIYVMGGMKGTPTFASADNPAASEKSFLTRALTFAYLPCFNMVNLLIYPNNLSFDWSMEAVPLIDSICDTRNFVTLATISVIISFVYQVSKDINIHKNNLYLQNLNEDQNKKGLFKTVTNIPPATIMGLAIIILPFIPAMNIFFYVGFVVAERVLYIPSMGYCIVVGSGLSQLWNNLICNPCTPNKSTWEKQKVKSECTNKILRYALVILTCITLMTFGLRTIYRNGDWLNEETLYRSGVNINPPKGKNP